MPCGTRGINVDLTGFEDAMAKQRAAARKSWSGSGETGEDKVWFAVADKVGPTEFLGYETEFADGAVTAIVKGGAMVETLAAGEEGFVVFNQTPFYGEEAAARSAIPACSRARASPRRSPRRRSTMVFSLIRSRSPKAVSSSASR